MEKTDRNVYIYIKKKNTTQNKTSRDLHWPLVLKVCAGHFLQLSNTRRRTRQTAAPAWRLSSFRLYSPRSRWSAITVSGGGYAEGLSAPPTGLEKGRSHRIEHLAAAKVIA